MSFLAAAPVAAAASGAATGAAGGGLLAGTSAAGLGSLMGASAAPMAAAPVLSSAAAMNSAAAAMGPSMASGVNIFEAAKTAGMGMLDKNPMMSFMTGNAKPQEMAGSGLDRFAAGFGQGDTGTALANFQSGNTSGGVGNLVGMSMDYNRKQEELRRQRGY